MRYVDPYRDEPRVARFLRWILSRIECTPENMEREGLVQFLNISFDEVLAEKSIEQERERRKK